MTLAGPARHRQLLRALPGHADPVSAILSASPWGIGSPADARAGGGGPGRRGGGMAVRFEGFDSGLRAHGSGRRDPRQRLRARRRTPRSWSRATASCQRFPAAPRWWTPTRPSWSSGTPREDRCRYFPSPSTTPTTWWPHHSWTSFCGQKGPLRGYVRANFLPIPRTTYIYVRDGFPVDWAVAASGVAWRRWDRRQTSRRPGSVAHRPAAPCASSQSLPSHLLGQGANRRSWLTPATGI